MLARANAQAFASIPLIQAGRWVGVITFNWQAPHAFTPQEAALYKAFIGMASPAVESQRLLKQTQARARREQTLREVTARLRGSTDPDAVMRALARELGTVLGRPTFVRLVTPGGGNAEELTQKPVPQMTGGDGPKAVS
jgi:GAF domain-containing protein